MTKGELLIVLLQVAAHVGRRAHLLLEALVESRRRIHAAVLEQVIQRDHLGDHRDILARIERNADLRQLDVEDCGRLTIEARAIDDGVLMPVLELHDDLETLLLAHGADAEHAGYVDQPDAAYFHVVPLQLMPLADQHVAAAAFDDHEIVGNQAVSAFDEIEYALGFADAAASYE